MSKLSKLIKFFKSNQKFDILSYLNRIELFKPHKDSSNRVLRLVPKCMLIPFSDVTVYGNFSNINEVKLMMVRTENQKIEFDIVVSKLNDYELRFQIPSASEPGKYILYFSFRVSNKWYNETRYYYLFKTMNNVYSDLNNKDLYLWLNNNIIQGGSSTETMGMLSYNNVSTKEIKIMFGLNGYSLEDTYITECLQIMLKDRGASFFIDYFFKKLHSNDISNYMVDIYGANAAHDLVENCSFPLYSYYVYKFPDRFTAPDHYGLTPLHYAVQNGDNNKVIKILHVSKRTSLMDFGDIHGMTALHWSIVLGHNKIFKTLIKCGASYVKKDKNGNSPHSIINDQKKYKHLRDWLNKYKNKF